MQFFESWLLHSHPFNSRVDLAGCETVLRTENLANKKPVDMAGCEWTLQDN